MDGSRISTPATPGDLIQTEDMGAPGKIQRNKLVIGIQDTDDGDVSGTNRMPTHQASATLSACGTVTATSAAQALPTASCSEVLLQNSGSVAVLVGTSGTQAISVPVNGSLSIEVTNANVVYVKTASSTATVNYLARS